jgi:hypothetical protein
MYVYVNIIVYFFDNILQLLYNIYNIDSKELFYEFM